MFILVHTELPKEIGTELDFCVFLQVLTSFTHYGIFKATHSTLPKSVGSISNLEAWHFNISFSLYVGDNLETKRRFCCSLQDFGAGYMTLPQVPISMFSTFCFVFRNADKLNDFHMSFFLYSYVNIRTFQFLCGEKLQYMLIKAWFFISMQPHLVCPLVIECTTLPTLLTGLTKWGNQTTILIINSQEIQLQKIIK